MKIVVYLGGSRGLAVLKSLIANKIIPEYVYFKQTSELSLLITECKSKSINFELINRDFSKNHLLFISKINPDLIVVSGFNSILPEELLSIPRFGGINCHAGRLPMYRGAAVIPWQIINGERFGEASVLEMTPGIDDGSILAQKKYSIEPDDSSRVIVDKVNKIFSDIVPQVINDYLRLGNKVNKIKQSQLEVCTWTQRFPEDGIVKWDKMKAIEVVNLSRALDDPYPGAYTSLCGMQIKIKKAKVHSELIKGVPGRYIGMRNGEMSIIASDRAVAILEYEVSNLTKKEIHSRLKVGANASNDVSF